MMTGAPMRVSTREVGEELLEQEQRDFEQAEWDRLRRQTASPRFPDLPHTTPGRSRSPLPQNLPPLPPSVSPLARELTGGPVDRMSMYGGGPGTGRSRTSNLPYVPAPGGANMYPGPVSPMPRMSFPPSSGNSTITPVIPGINFPSAGYPPAPLDGATSYPDPVVPMDGGRSPSASTIRLIGPGGASPGHSRAGFGQSPIALPSVPSLSRTAGPLHFGQTPHIHSDDPNAPLLQGAGQTPFARPLSPMPSRPASRMSGSMARTDRIRPHELPGTQAYDVAPGNHVYPPPLTPQRGPMPPSPAMSRHSMRSHVTTATQRGDGGGAWNF